MAKGYPDYATPYSDILAERGYINLLGRYGGSVAGGSYGDLLAYTVPSGYIIQVSFCSMSANGCEAYHTAAVYVDGILQKSTYFEVVHFEAFPRYLTVKEGQLLGARFYNYGDAARTFEVWYGGILITIGTEPLNPQLDPGIPPELAPDETLFLVDNPFEGRVWRKVKNIPIPKSGWERDHPPLYLPKGVK